MDAKKQQAKVIDLTELNLPLYTTKEEKKGIPEAVADYVSQFSAAKGFIFAVPEYNGGVPPVVSNTIAWISRGADDWRGCFNGKPAIISSYSGGGGNHVLMALRIQLSLLGMNVFGRQIIVNSKQQLNSEHMDATIDLLIASLVHH